MMIWMSVKKIGIDWKNRECFDFEEALFEEGNTSALLMWEIYSAVEIKGMDIEVPIPLIRRNPFRDA